MKSSRRNHVGRLFCIGNPPFPTKMALKVSMQPKEVGGEAEAEVVVEEEKEEEAVNWIYHRFALVGDDTLVFKARSHDQSKFLDQGLVTGHAVWPVSKLIVAYLVEHKQELFIGSRPCLELGCGLGICGLAAAALGAKHVILTDGDVQVLLLAQEAVEANRALFASDSCIVETRVLRWGGEGEEDGGYCDVILCSDVLYGPSLPAEEATLNLDTRCLHLFRAASQRMDEETVFLLGFENRGDVRLDDVLTAAEHMNWSCVPVGEYWEDIFANRTEEQTSLWARCVLRLQQRRASVDQQDA